VLGTLTFLDTSGAQNGDGFIDCSHSRVLRVDLAANSRWIKGAEGVGVFFGGAPASHRYWKILMSLKHFGLVSI